jgi:hypothetical protein
MVNIKRWQDRAPIWAAKDTSPVTRREEAMQQEIVDLRAVIEQSSSSLLSLDASENVRTAITLISGFFEHESMPASVTEVVSGLSNLISEQEGADQEEASPVDSAEAMSDQPPKAGLSHAVIRDVLVRHLGWLGAMSWNDDIRAISNDILKSVNAAPVSQDLLSDIYTGLHAILGGTDDKFINVEAHKIIDLIDASRSASPIDFNSLQRYGFYAVGKGGELGPQAQGPYVLVRDVLEYLSAGHGTEPVKLTPIPGLKLVVFDELGEGGQPGTPFVIDDERARTFHQEEGFLASHLEPIYRNAAASTPLLPLAVDTPELRRLVSEYRQACEMVQAHAVPQWRHLVEHISKVCASQISDAPTWEMLQAREQDIRALQSKVIELSSAGGVDLVGWKRVPLVPTDDMVVAFAETWYTKKRCFDDPEMNDAYTAMIEAAPAAPSNSLDWRQIVVNVLSYNKQGLYTNKVALSKLRRAFDDELMMSSL